MKAPVIDALARLLATLRPALDIVEQRVDDASVPDWCAARGWAGYLLSLDERELERCEAEGLAEAAPSLPGLPPSLGDLAGAVRAASVLPRVAPSVTKQRPRELRSVSSRKQGQLAALLAALRPLAAGAHRIVDVGSGSGHLTRLSAREFQRDALGVERNARLVDRANARELADANAAELADAQARRGAVKPPPFAARFVVVDAVRQGIELCASDLALGLHACGELADTLSRAVAASGAHLALVTCCLQKISGESRSALSQAAHGFALRKPTLGLSNLSSQAMGVETSIEKTMRARQTRFALRLLLRERGFEIAPGAEMHGVNRRRAHAGLAEVAARALALRNLPGASEAELSHHEREAERYFAVVRRLSLPRNMLARVLELCVVFDRAAYLVEHGHEVRVALAFERALSPRNVCIFASRDAARLPEVHEARS